MTAAYVNTSDTVRSDLDPLTAVATVEVRGDKLKQGMVLVDPTLCTPEAEIDHRLPAVRGSSQASYLVFNYDLRRLTVEHVGARSMIKVMARTS